MVGDLRGRAEAGEREAAKARVRDTEATIALCAAAGQIGLDPAKQAGTHVEAFVADRLAAVGDRRHRHSHSHQLLLFLHLQPPRLFLEVALAL